MVYAYPDTIEQICSNDGEEDVEDTPPFSVIQQFYEGANVFVTGSTGFIGMALTEKLLRSCPGINKLFLLVRSRRGKTPEERVKEMLQNPVFSRLLLKYPKTLEKVNIVEGDVEQCNLGISASDTELLKKEIHIVINVAATVRFDEPLRKAYTINVVSLRSMLALAESMSNLKAFIHTSTLFCHVYRKSKDVLERFFAPAYTESEIENLLSSADDYTLACLSSQILGEVPNTYCLTKAMGEEIIREKMNSLPLAIYRPSVVLNSYKEPVHGWSPTLQTAGAVMTGMGLGVLRLLISSGDKRVDVIPVCKSACALVALPWYTHSLRQNKVAISPIYNHVADRPPITFEKMMTVGTRLEYEEELSSKNQVWAFNVSFEPNPFMYKIKFWVYHVLPLPLFVLAEKLQKQPPRLAKLYRKMVIVLEQSRPFSDRNWSFDSSNMISMWSSMPDQDRRIFPLDVGDIDWTSYSRFASKGSIVYLLKENFAEHRGHTRTFKIILLVDEALRLFNKALKIFFVYKFGALVISLLTTYLENQINIL